MKSEEHEPLLEVENKTKELPSRPSPPPVSYFSLYSCVSASMKSLLLIGYLSSASSGTLYTALYYFIGKLYEVDDDDDEDDIYKDACHCVSIMALLGFASLSFGAVSSYCFCRVSQAIGQFYRTRYFHSILSKDVAYFDMHNAAEIPTKMSNDCESVEKGTGDRILIFTESASFCISGMLLAFGKSPQLVVVGVGFVFVGLFGNILFVFAIMKGAQMVATKYAKAAGIAEESLLEVKTVSAFNAQSYFSKKYNAELEAPMALAARLTGLGGSGRGIVWLAWAASSSTIFWAASKWICDGNNNWLWSDKMDGAKAIFVFFIFAYNMMSMGSMAPGIAVAIEARFAAARAQEFFNEPVEFRNGTKKLALQGRIELEGVHFAYPKQPERPVLKGLSFVCEPGQKTAIVGESGAGKSTIVQLLERFYEPSQGHILYDSVFASILDISDLRRQVGYVSQEPVLFNLSVKENILISCPTASEEKIDAAIEHANVKEFLADLKDGVNTVVGMKGSRLSGGQKQRVAIARAIVKDPKVLLLDEATSALDSESERAVLGALGVIHAKRKLTIVSIAQKLSTITNSDKIVVLRDGQNEEEGTHETLMARNGLYASMYAAQGTVAKGPETSEIAKKQVSMAHLPAEESDVSMFAASGSSKFPLLRLSESLLKSWPFLILAIGSACACGLSFPMLGYYLAKEITYITADPGDYMRDNVAKISKYLLILAAFMLASFTTMYWTFGWISARATLTLRKQAFLKMLHLDAAFFDKKSSNAQLLTQNLNSDAAKVSDAGGMLLGSIISILISFSIGIAIALVWVWKLGLVVAAAFPIECFMLFRGYVVRIRGTAHPDHQQASAFVLDSTLNIKTVAAFQMQDELEKRYENSLRKVFEDTNTECILNGATLGLCLATVLWMLSLDFWYGSFLKKNGDASGEDVNIAIFSTFLTFIGVTSMMAFVADLEQGTRAASRIFALIDYVPSINSLSDAGDKREIIGSITFEGVSFKYPQSGIPILKHISFSMAQGQHFGITGASGSGKSTLTQLLLRFYDPQEGRILIDGMNLSAYNVQHLRRSIAFVGQEPVLFSGSVKDNVDFGLGKSNEEVQRVLVAARIAHYADKLDDQVGFRGTKVSGGQKQRIAIARAILRDPKILILDEATSALDSKTEQQIILELDAAGQGRTVVMIAHRLSTIEKCDQIIVLDGGEIKEQGTHESLVALEDGVYRKLLVSSIGA